MSVIFGKQPRVLLGAVVLMLAAFRADAQQAAEISHCRIIDADTDLPIAEHDPIVDGARVALDLADAWSIEAWAATRAVHHVRFQLLADGLLLHERTDRQQPYALFGDRGGDFRAWPGAGPQPGILYTLVATPVRRGGQPNGPAYSVTFEFIVDEPPVECSSDAECDNGAFCDGAETCLEGQCQSGADPCASSFCDDNVDSCVDCLNSDHCADGVYCNGAESCVEGVCVSGTEPCPELHCVEADNDCVACTIDEHCDDGLFCNGPEACLEGTCYPGQQPCPGQMCLEDGDECVMCLEDEHCADGVFCNGAETCVDGACQAGVDPCPEAYCSEGMGACAACLNDGHCDDRRFCTGEEHCVNGACQAGQDPCPEQQCDESSDACVDCLEDEECTDGVFCNGAEACVEGTCHPGTDPCPDTMCSEDSTGCVACLDDADCDDDTFCNGNEVCTDGACEPGGNPCPGQFCVEDGAICAACLNDGHCDDGLFCNGLEACVAGDCQIGSDPCPGGDCDETSDACVLVEAGCPVYMDAEQVGTVQGGSDSEADVNEASGLVCSRNNTAVLWTHNDDWGDNRLFALRMDGTVLGTFITGTGARDPEDIAIGPGPIEGIDYLYWGDIGDNNNVHSTIFVKRVPEPAVDANQDPVTATLSGVDVIELAYPTGADAPSHKDAETLLVDPLNGDIYVITKRTAVGRVYRAAYPQSTTQPTTMEFVAMLPWGGATGGDVSADGSRIIVRRYTGNSPQASIWMRSPGMALWSVFEGERCDVPLHWERQGEAIGFDVDGQSYLTISEDETPDAQIPIWYFSHE